MSSKRITSACVIDVGSKANIGWAFAGAHSGCGDDVDAFIEAIVDASTSGPIAIGFEAPLFVPYHRDATHLTRARDREGDRPYSASAGASVLVSALTVVPYVLGALRPLLPTSNATLEWRTRGYASSTILLFEAFVSHQDKVRADKHVADARRAADQFLEHLATKTPWESDISEPSSFSLLGAAMLRTGWATDLSVLSHDCLVVRCKG